MVGWQFLFWGSVGAIMFAYIGYPALLRLLCLFRENPVKMGDITPRVTLVISAYNEETVLPARIDNALALDYPPEQLDIVVVSDGSTDGTNGIIRDFAGRNLRVSGWFSEENRGKTACLNVVVPNVRGDVVTFSDANSMYESNALRALVRPLSDPRVGFVTGTTNYVSAASPGAELTAGMYTRLERWVKQLESRLGSCVGADGAIFAIRKELFRPMGISDINDLVTPLAVVAQGFRGVIVTEAMCFEAAHESPKAEFQRQTRITARTLQALFSHWKSCISSGGLLFAFQVFSHKLLRFSAPVFLVAIYGASLALAAGEKWFYLAALVAQSILYCLAFWSRGTQKPSLFPAVRVLNLVHDFAWINLAYASGWVKYLRGEKFISWTPQRNVL